MSDVTLLLDAVGRSDAQAMDKLLALVYDELRGVAAAKLAREQSGQTLQPTALVHEAFLRLLGADAPVRWENRRHFFGAAAEAMRRILVDNARSKQRLKRGDGRRSVELKEQLAVQTTMDESDLLAVHEALDKLAEAAPDVAELVKLHYFAGLPFKEAAGILGIPERTAKRHWAYARGWLFRELGGKTLHAT
ncbi:MAG TPA: sigma-70 family RNA polymerase sigma factor [Planctomycetota bacterium]|nr:sigma-70 family RNA polymerase sigma factor [Planctomycetota bacterium]